MVREAKIQQVSQDTITSLALALGKREADRNLTPTLNCDPVAPRRNEPPSRADRLNRAIIQRIEARRPRDLDSLDRPVRPHLDSEQHGTVLPSAARFDRIRRSRILAVFDVRER